MSTFALVFGLCILAVATASALVARHRQNRTLRHTAADCSLSFSTQDVLNVYDRYYQLAILRRGHHRTVWNLLYGSTEVGRVALFCYQYELGLGARQEPHRHWVGIMETPRQSEAWQLMPEAPRHPPAKSSDRLGERCLVGDRPGAAERLRSLGTEQTLAHAVAADHFEAQPGLLAVITPHTDNDRTPARLLQLLKTMASRLATKS